MSGEDQIYRQHHEKISSFRFDSRVVSVFEDMIERSVPGYAAIVGMTGELAHQYAQSHSLVYDLGCSLGASSHAMLSWGLPENCRLLAVDNSPEMIDELRQRIGNWDLDSSAIELQCEDIRDLTLQPCSFVAMNFTLQFLPLEHRLPLLQRIASALLPGGALLLSEKFRHQDDATDALMIDLHHQFKRSMGYSDLEIAQKRSALEDVLIPESLQNHRDRLLQAGFSQVGVWFQCFNFASLIAIR